MSWPWRMPRDLRWATPYPLPRDTSEALLAEGRCENFGLVMDRYLAFGDNRGRLELLREFSNRRALVPDYTGLSELIAAHDARWRQTADDLGAITFTARPQWRVIIGLGTNDVLGGGITLHPIFGFPIVPATALKGVSRAYARWVSSRPKWKWTHCWGRWRKIKSCEATCCSSKAAPSIRRWSRATWSTRSSARITGTRTRRRLITSLLHRSSFWRSGREVVTGSA